MSEKQKIPESVIRDVLALYGLSGAFDEQREYIHYNGEFGDGLVKMILSVRLESGGRVVLKILREEGDLLQGRAKIERQSDFSEQMRRLGIQTPKRYMANGRYCNEFFYGGRACNVSVEDWCGEEIKEITPEISYKIGVLMAKMHTLSLKNGLSIGCGTLFSAAYENDVDAFGRFCELCEDERLDREISAQIKRLREEGLQALRSVWDTLPKAAVQGDISVNNLVYGGDELRVFDYNNAGDEVLVSDLVMQGLLTAYEMELPVGADPASREALFPALLEGYLSVRKLSAKEADAAWRIYALYHALWFTRILYNEDSLEKLVERGDYAAANRLLERMLADMTERDDGRFRK